MLTGTCHCGAVRIEVGEAPPAIIDCNCSICRRTGAWWALVDPAAVRVRAAPGATCGYVWGARSIRTVRCRSCGCVTHWEPLAPGAPAQMGVNTRNFDPAAVAGVRRRRFDGAQTWAYLDDA